jgi:hypothetical protein
MGEWLITLLALLGLASPLLPKWRVVLAATLLFAVGNWALLSQLDATLATEPNPGPGARGIALLAYAPTAAFLASCAVRAVFEAARYARRYFSNRLGTTDKNSARMR